MSSISVIANRRVACRVAGLVVGLFSAPLAVHAAKAGKVERREMKNEAAVDLGDARVTAKPKGEDAAIRLMTKLRDQFEVTDDAEWAVIAERISQVNDLRARVALSAGVRGSVGVPDKVKRSTRTETAGVHERDALRTAVRDKLPDAEIKARLARVHDAHVQNEGKLAKAQEELRAILTLRQEAVAVVSGLLPP